ncbi:MAG: hypothetical protein AB9M53_00975 [Leptothrix sp. (in: b-proteobacteria)]
MSSANLSKIDAATFAAAPATEVYNIYEVAAILRVSANQVRQRVRLGTVPQPLHTVRDQRQWTKAMLTAAGITSVGV